MHAVNAVGQEFFGVNGTFPVLEELVFKDMLNWEEWTCSTEVFPCLSKLEVRNCPMLIGELPSQLSSLVELVIEECPKLRSFDHSSLPSCQQLLIRGCGAISTVVLTCFSRLESLRIERCSSLKCIAGGKIPTSLKSLKIEACENLESLPNGVAMQGDFYSSKNNSIELTMQGELSSRTSSSLKEFEVGDCNKLKSLSEGMLQYCTALESITIGGYETLKSFLSLESSLSNLERLKIYGIDGCESLPEMGLSFPNLKYLQIDGCESLPEMGLSFPNLKYLQIDGCPSIECIPDGGLPPSLSELRIWGCENLNSLPDTMGLLESIRSLLINNCKNLKSLPKSMYSLRSLEKLWISGCPGIECIAADGRLPPNLSELQIWGCENLKSLPKSMYSLRSLETLWIMGCPGIECIAAADGRLPPNLTELELTECENLKSLPNTVCELTSLRVLSICNGNLMAGWNLHSLTSLRLIRIEKACPPPDLLLPSSVTSVGIRDVETEESIPKELFQNLNSLLYLTLQKCPKLQSLPKEAMPPSLGSLCIDKCPLLTRQRFEAKGDYWPLTRNIPCVMIDWVQVDSSP